MFNLRLEDLITEEDIPETEKVPEQKSKSGPDGTQCKRCKDFVLMAEANQEDGSFVCYLCRDNPWR